MTIPNNKIRSKGAIEQHEHCDDASARRVKHVDENGSSINYENPLPVANQENTIAKLTANLLSILVNSDINSSEFIVDNDNFFVYDNQGNFIKEG